jgi:hypothetical protein
MRPALATFCKALESTLISDANVTELAGRRRQNVVALFGFKAKGVKGCLNFVEWAKTDDSLRVARLRWPTRRQRLRKQRRPRRRRTSPNVRTNGLQVTCWKFRKVVDM